MVANGCIPKPTFWTFKFYKNLKDRGAECAYRSDNAVIMRKTGGGWCGIAWNVGMDGGNEELELKLSLDAADGEYSFVMHTACLLYTSRCV